MLYAQNPFEDVEMEYLTDHALKLNLDKEVMVQKINQYDIIATTPVYLNKLHQDLHTNYDQYIKTPYQYKEDLEVLLDIIKDKYLDYYKLAYDYIYKLPYGYYCNMFIMKKELFMEYSAWLFDILEEHEKRRDYSEYILEVVASKKWQLLDQDIFNKLCEHKVKVLDMSWNVMYNYRKPPKIIHYAGLEKPWLFPKGDFADIFWEYTKQTPYYEVMLYRMACYAANRINEIHDVYKGANRNKSYNVVAKTIRYLFLHGSKYTFEEIGRVLGRK